MMEEIDHQQHTRESPQRRVGTVSRRSRQSMICKPTPVSTHHVVHVVERPAHDPVSSALGAIDEASSVAAGVADIARGLEPSWADVATCVTPTTGS